MKNPTRRQAIKSAMAVSAVIPVATLFNQTAQAGGHMPKVDPESAAAKALQYTETSPDEAKLCSGCQLYTGEEGKEIGPCSIFPGQEVAAAGWCLSWVAKA